MLDDDVQGRLVQWLRQEPKEFLAVGKHQCVLQ